MQIELDICGALQMFTNRKALKYLWPLICIIETLAVVNFALLHSKLPFGFLCYSVACAKVKKEMKQLLYYYSLNQEYRALLRIHGGRGWMSCRICSRSANKKL